MKKLLTQIAATLIFAISMYGMGVFMGYQYFYKSQAVKVYEDGSFAGCQHNAPCQD